MHKIAETAYETSPLIVKANGRYFEKTRKILVANTLGVWAEDSLTKSRYSLNVIAQKDNLSEENGENFGGLLGFEMFDNQNLEEFSKKIANEPNKALIVIGNGLSLDTDYGYVEPWLLSAGFECEQIVPESLYNYAIHKNETL